MALIAIRGQPNVKKRSGGTLTLVGGNHRCDGTWTGDTSSADNQLYHIRSPGVGYEVGVNGSGVK